MSTPLFLLGLLASGVALFKGLNLLNNKVQGRFFIRCPVCGKKISFTEHGVQYRVLSSSREELAELRYVCDIGRFGEPVLTRTEGCGAEIASLWLAHPVVLDKLRRVEQLKKTDAEARDAILTKSTE